MGVVAAVDHPAPLGPAARLRRGTPRGAWVGVAPFVLYVALFLGGPLYEVLYGALTTNKGALTWSNFSATFHAPFPSTFQSSIKLAVITTVLGGLFGLWLACAVVTSGPRSPLRRIVGSASGVLAYFAGVPLAFAFIASLGRFGEITVLLQHVGVNLNDTSFTITSLTGVEIVYVYFQIPLMVLLITPALEGLRAEWREAATGLGASSFGYVRYVAGPVLAPAIIGAMLLLFGNAFAAYATAYALIGSSANIVPSVIEEHVSSNVLVNQVGVGLALGVEMVVVVAAVMVGYALLQRRAGRWIQ